MNLSDLSGPRHDPNCLAGNMNDAACFCARADWLGEQVTRAQARIELLATLEKWAREQSMFDDADLGRSPSRTTDLVMAGIRAAQSITRTTYERMAVRTLNMTRECSEVLRRAQVPTEVDDTITQHATHDRL